MRQLWKTKEKTIDVGKLYLETLMTVYELYEEGKFDEVLQELEYFAYLAERLGLFKEINVEVGEK